MKTPVILAAAWGLFFSPILASEESPDVLSNPIFLEPEIKAVDVPEPNPLLFAGLGGLVLLMCAVRRK
jgi:hypothetical protein